MLDVSWASEEVKYAATALVLHFPNTSVVTLAASVVRAQELLRTDQFPSINEPHANEVLYAMEIMAGGFPGGEVIKF